MLDKANSNCFNKFRPFATTSSVVLNPFLIVFILKSQNVSL